MASISLSVPLTPPVTPGLNVGPIAATAPVAVIAAEAEALALPLPQAAAPAPAAAPEQAHDGAAMRPDQVFMARQLAWPAPDGAALASAWRGMVRGYGAELASREQQARASQLAGSLLAAGLDPRAARQPEPGLAPPPDAWRFTVHPDGPHAQRLRVIADEADQPPGRRKRARAALRLELELADGVRVTVQVEPLPEGVVLELCASGTGNMRRLQDLQPALEAAVERAGLRVLRWRFRDSLPPGVVHARLPAADATAMLTLPVFRALAEMALLLPLRTDAAV